MLKIPLSRPQTGLKNTVTPDGKGGQGFNGNSVKKLLNHIDTLEELIVGHPLEDELDKVVSAFHAFKEVTDLCFGMELKSGYALAIDRFMDFYRQIENLNVTVKVHILEVHVCDFFERKKGTEFEGKGLGFWSEQASESVHADVEKARAGNARALEDPKYAEQFFKLGVKYNSNHL